MCIYLSPSIAFTDTAGPDVPKISHDSDGFMTGPPATAIGRKP